MRMDSKPPARPLADGILVVNKAKESTSMEVVRVAKRVTRVKRVGHAGTLDPIATGVLPICFGQATRLMEYLVDGRKIYRAEFTLGAATDTYDSYGVETHSSDWASVTREQVEAQFPAFTGVVLQQPPMYSALKHEGKRLYELARAGIEVEREAREVVVHKMTLLDWAPPKLTVEVECGRGFYMRTLAHDMGVALGCYAHLSELTRAQAGAFTLDDAIAIEEFEAVEDEEAWMELLLPPDAALRSMDALTLDAAAERHLRNGQAVTLAGSVYTKHLEARRAYAVDGRFLGIVRFNRAESQWQPEKVFNLAKPSRFAP
jgi:tRNA pseudouridine55 synthase